MIVLIAEMQARPGCEHELETLLRTLIPSVSQEAGTVAYTLNRVREASGHFVFYEKYRDQASFDSHMAGESLGLVLKAAKDLLAQAPRLTVCEELDSITGCHADDRYYLIESCFQKPFDTFGEAVPRHRAWLQEFYDQGVMLCSGPKSDRTGGVMLARASDEAPLRSFIEGDPYRQAGLAEYRLTEFNAAKKSRVLE